MAMLDVACVRAGRPVNVRNVSERELWCLVKGERRARCVACAVENTAVPRDQRLAPLGTEVRIIVDGELMATKLLKGDREQTCEAFGEDMRRAFTNKGWMPMMDEH